MTNPQHHSQQARPGISRRAVLSGTAVAAAGLAVRPGLARAATELPGRAGAGLDAGPAGHTITTWTSG